MSSLTNDLEGGDNVNALVWPFWYRTLLTPEVFSFATPSAVTKQGTAPVMRNVRPVARMLTVCVLVGGLLLFSSNAAVAVIEYQIEIDIVSEGRYSVGFELPLAWKQARKDKNGNEDGWEEWFNQVRWQDRPGGPEQSQEIGPGDGRCNESTKRCYFSFQFVGPPGSKGLVKSQSCHRQHFDIPLVPLPGVVIDIPANHPSVCSGFAAATFVIPEGRPPQYEPPRLVRIEPSTYMPQQYRTVSDFEPTDKQMAVSTPANARALACRPPRGVWSQITSENTPR
jgi:hypothetical protein